jgi:hypothetical protein
MNRYRVIRVPHSDRWAVEESIAGGRAEIVGSLYTTAREAHMEADRLTALNTAKRVS